MERVNQETMKHLRAITYEGGVKRNWSQYLPLVQRIINNSFHSAIGTTPSRVVFGDRIFLDRGFDKILQQPKNSNERTTYEDYIQELNSELRTIASKSVAFQDKVIRDRMSKSPENPTTFEVGDLVLVSYPERPPDKLTSVWRGPLVVQSIDNQTYVCQDLVTMQLAPYFVTRLKKFHDDNTIEPLALAAIDRDELEVESIVGHTGSPKERKSMTFRVRWRGFQPEDDTWEPWSQVYNLQALDEYIATHPHLYSLKHNYTYKKDRKPKAKTKNKKK